jgi:cytochrome c biogenesis protein CcmG/thiol:disulfide interchange protein DsbE
VVAVGGVTAWAVTSSSSPSPAPGVANAPPPSAPTLHAPSGPAGGSAAPAFSLQTLSGGQISLASLAGHPVLVNFWASWCHPCRQEFPLFKAALARHQAQGLEIVGISFQDIASDARAFIHDEHASWIFARDDDGAVAAAYGVRPVPETFFVRRDGTIAGRLRGITSAHELDGDLRAILPA